MGKRKDLSEANLKEQDMPQQGEVLGKANKMTGGDQVIVKCADGVTRQCRIRGKLKRRMWIREGDVVLVAPWDFDNGKADILWRYIRAHEEWLNANGYLKRI